MKKEYWRPVVGYEGLYEVSNWGRVKSLDTYRKGINGSVRFCKERILKQGKDKFGYLYVDLYKNNIKKKYKVHRLVAEAFLDNPDNLPCVNHKDENKQNNIVSNLEWCNYSYNNSYGTRNEKVSKKLSKIVLQYTLDGQFVREWPSTMECGRNEYNQGHVTLCCLGKQKTHKDFIWKYK